MFLFKKIVSPLFMPLTLCLLILMIGLILLWWKKKERLGRILVTFGVLLLTLMSYGVIAKQLSTPLECRYPSVRLSEAADARWVVVLSGGVNTKEGSPATSQLSKDSLYRLAEGIRLQRQIPGSRLLLSGGAVFQPIPEAEVMARAARELGVHEKDIVLESSSRDTENQALILRDIVGKDKFIVITSASHMPRAMALFKKKNLSPVAAPAGACITKKESFHPGDFYPSAGALDKSEAAFHEYLGILWAKLRGVV